MIKPDLLSSQTLSRDVDGYRAERSYMIDMVPGNAESKLYNAMTTSGIPQLDDPHPVIPDVKVTNVSAAPNESGENVIVKVTYTIPKGEAITNADETQADTINLQTSLQTEKTFLDVNGDFMRVVWFGRTIETKFVSADVQRPQMEINFERAEPAIPKAAIISYLGKVNSTPWSGFPAKTWLCSSINTRENKEGEFKITYSFSYRPETWRVEAAVALTDKQINELPPDVDTGNGYGRFDVYKTIDFSGLGLSF